MPHLEAHCLTECGEVRIGPKVGASDSRPSFCPRPTTARWVNRNTAGFHSGTKFRKWTLSSPPFGTLRAPQPTFFILVFWQQENQSLLHFTVQITYTTRIWLSCLWLNARVAHTQQMLSEYQRGPSGSINIANIITKAENTSGRVSASSCFLSGELCP